MTKAALEPFRVSTPERERPLLPYLREPGPMLYDIDAGGRPDARGRAPRRCIARTNYREMYYSAAQQLAHHTTSGCPMRVGDLLGSGTISGPEQDSRGSLLELSWGGKEPIDAGGRRHAQLHRGRRHADPARGGDRATATASASAPAPGTVLPAADLPDWAKE